MSELTTLGKHLARYGENVAIAVDQLGNAATGGMPDETISSRSNRLKDRWPFSWLYAALDSVFPGHCEKSEESEKEHLHEPKELR
jgi:hypothetical protein